MGWLSICRADEKMRCRSAWKATQLQCRCRNSCADGGQSGDVDRRESLRESGGWMDGDNDSVQYFQVVFFNFVAFFTQVFMCKLKMSIKTVG